MIAALLLFLAPAAPSAVPRLSLAPRFAQQWVPFALTRGNQIRFAMQVDGWPASAILDTGVSQSVMTHDFARSAGIAVLPRGSADAIGGMVPIGWAATRSVALGALTRSGGGMVVAQLSEEASGAQDIDLLIGRDLLAGYALDIDFAAGRFRLLPSGWLPFAGTPVPLAIAPELQVYVSEATVGGRRMKPVIVDTGDGSALTVSRRAWAGVDASGLRLSSGIAFGLGGAIETDVAVLPNARIGDLPTGPIELRIERNNGFSEQMGVAGRIGTGLLQRYRVLLDPIAGRMVLRPAASSAPPVRSTSGLLLAYRGTSARVLHVMRGSPAADGGWQVGETICSVDGVAVPSAPPAAYGAWTIGTPGRTIRLRMCDGSERALTLRDFY